MEKEAMMKLATLSDRAVLEVTGEDRVAFLQGLVSQDIALAAPGRALWSALLTPQGKWLADFFVLAAGDRLLLDVESAQRDMIAARHAALPPPRQGLRDYPCRSRFRSLGVPRLMRRQTFVPSPPIRACPRPAGASSPRRRCRPMPMRRKWDHYPPHARPSGRFPRPRERGRLYCWRPASTS